ncbi:MAG TPA: FAD-binding domain-containing protein, partial [Thermoanaerobaculia bacterium]|nr:FAD-binding domain-containing protein [Thermoanaerobaculia bacterium]
RLSPHLRFGTIGVRRLLAEAREVWQGASPSGRASVETFVKELAWREFYAGILESFPRTATENFRREFDRFPWASGEEAERRLGAWSAGRTGYPIVDAGIRQLLAEGWMHNRVRMIAASFLTKDLLVDWRKGEAFFRRHLADGDLASNNGGWQWAAGSGTDAQPFFRIFNPVLQGRRFDPEGAYVRAWLPELARARTAQPAAIHAPWLLPSPPPDYPAPVVDHAVARAAALAAFAEIRG